MHVIDSSCMAYTYQDRVMSMLYDTCGILDLIQSISIPSHRQNMAIIPEAVTAHLIADLERFIYVNSTDEISIIYLQRVLLRMVR